MRLLRTYLAAIFCLLALAAAAAPAHPVEESCRASFRRLYDEPLEVRLANHDIQVSVLLIGCSADLEHLSAGDLEKLRGVGEALVRELGIAVFVTAEVAEQREKLIVPRFNHAAPAARISDVYLWGGFSEYARRKER